MQNEIGNSLEKKKVIKCTWCFIIYQSILNIVEQRYLEYNLIAYHIRHRYNVWFLNRDSIYLHLGQKNNSLCEIVLSIALACQPWCQHTKCLWGPRIIMISKNAYTHVQILWGYDIVPNCVRFIGIGKFDKAKTLSFSLLNFYQLIMEPVGVLLLSWNSLLHSHMPAPICLLPALIFCNDILFIIAGDFSCYSSFQIDPGTTCFSKIAYFLDIPISIKWDEWYGHGEFWGKEKNRRAVNLRAFSFHPRICVQHSPPSIWVTSQKHLSAYQILDSMTGRTSGE